MGNEKRQEEEEEGGRGGVLHCDGVGHVSVKPGMDLTGAEEGTRNKGRGRGREKGKGERRRRKGSEWAENDRRKEKSREVGRPVKKVLYLQKKRKRKARESVGQQMIRT
jgi:hypothetical protein